MKKLLTIITLSIVLSLSLPILASANENVEVTTTSHIEYHSLSKSYFLITEFDGCGQWVLFLLHAENFDQNLLHHLHNIFEEKEVEITYLDDEELTWKLL